MSERALTALVLSGGGARGAYQAGVLLGLSKLGVVPENGFPFDILVGSSAGALNAGLLASQADHFGVGVSTLERVWSGLEPQKVFRTDLRSLGGIGARWVRDLSFGGMLRRVSPKSLLDTAPLRDLLEDEIPFRRIGENIASGALRALAIPATNLYTADGVVFVQTRPEIALWERVRWSIERTEIRVDHLLASSAIPIFFPSIEIDGRHFGDGSIRNTAPLSPAIRLGADRIVAIGVRQPGQLPEGPGADRPKPPSVAQIAGALLDAVMLDAMEVDVEHSERVNRSVLAYPTGSSEHPFRTIDVLWLSPSRTFGEIAAEHRGSIPGVVSYLMRGLGEDEQTEELASYLLFDPTFCTRLVELGVADVAAREAEIREFFSEEAGAGER